MQKTTFFILVLFLLDSNCLIAQQSFSPIKVGNLSGVLGATANPANLADNHYKWDVNLMSVNEAVANNNTSFKFSTLFNNPDLIFDSVFTNKNNKAVNMNANVDVVGPSFMYNTGNKWSFALTTRGRFMANLQDFDPNFVESIDNATNNTLPYSFASTNNQKFNFTSWSEIGASAATILHNQSSHFIKAGATVKYLMGYANVLANVNQLKATVNEDLLGDIFFTNTTGTIAVGNSGFEEFNNGGSEMLKKRGSGIGFDVGAIYEYRPESYSKKYKYKFGVAINDIGSIKFKPTNNQFANYTIAITGSETWYPSDIDGLSLDELTTYLDSKPNLFTKNTASNNSYKVSLPTTINLSAGMHLYNNFYLDATANVSLAKKSNFYSPTFANNYTATPYFETNKIGVYLPFNYNAVSGFNVGFAVKAGPLFLGSNSLINGLFNTKSLDAFVGIRFGGRNKKENKDE